MMTPFLGLDPVFPPLGAASLREQASWPDSKVLSSSAGSASSASSYWEEELASKLAAKLLLLEGAQEAPRRRPSETECWGDDYLNSSSGYRSANPRFKTEVCRNFKEKGTCLYGELCQFAHGKHELRRDVARHAKYKTKLCQKYWIAGYCAYGPRCNFIHQEIEREAAMRLLAMGGAEARGGAVYRALRPLGPLGRGAGDEVGRTTKVEVGRGSEVELGRNVDVEVARGVEDEVERVNKSTNLSAADEAVAKTPKTIEENVEARDLTRQIKKKQDEFKSLEERFTSVMSVADAKQEEIEVLTRRLEEVVEERE